MAEERIIVVSKKLEPCIGCHKEEECFDYCTSFWEWQNGMTRQEAIERMAKAIRERACEGYLHKDTDPLTSTASAIDYAEAALNAIAPMIPQEAQN